MFYCAGVSENEKMHGCPHVFLKPFFYPKQLKIMFLKIFLYLWSQILFYWESI